MIASIKCLAPGCEAKAGNPRDYKGLCVKCYSAAKRMVESGESTWEELQRMSLAKLEETPFEQAFKSVKEGGR